MPDLGFLTPLMLCVLILYISGGTYSLKSTPSDIFFEKLFHGCFYLLSEFLSEICWPEIAEEILFVFCFDVWPGAQTLVLRLIRPLQTPLSAEYKFNFPYLAHAAFLIQSHIIFDLISWKTSNPMATWLSDSIDMSCTFVPLIQVELSTFFRLEDTVTFLLFEKR